MRNGFDHSGTCNVVLTHRRKEEPPPPTAQPPAQPPLPKSSFALLDAMPADVLAHLSGSALAAADVLTLERCSRKLYAAVRSSESLVWQTQLGGLMGTQIEMAPHGSHAEQALLQLANYRMLYRVFNGALEVKGWETAGDSDDAVPCDAGNMNAWWRCHAVGLRVRSHPKPVAISSRGSTHSHPACGHVEVKVRYRGYAETDDEWRSMCSLRRASAVDPAFSSTRARVVGECIECSAPPCPGHPSALWEGRVQAVAVDGAAGGSHRPNKGRKLLVRFKDFGPEFDEWIHAESKRVRAPGSGGGAVCASFGAPPPQSAPSTPAAVGLPSSSSSSAVAKASSSRAARGSTGATGRHSSKRCEVSSAARGKARAQVADAATPCDGAEGSGLDGPLLLGAAVSAASSCALRCCNMLERDGGAFGCTLAAWHDGVHCFADREPRNRPKVQRDV